MLREALGIGACRKSCPDGSWVGLGFFAWPSAWKVRAKEIAVREMARFGNIMVYRWRESAGKQHGVQFKASAWVSFGWRTAAQRLKLRVPDSDVQNENTQLV
jgi:hypothetical protein